MRVLGLLLHHPEGEEMAANALSDEKVEVRIAAASALGQMGAAGTVGKLKEALKDKEVGVILAAANALKLLGDPIGTGIVAE